MFNNGRKESYYGSRLYPLKLLSFEVASREQATIQHITNRVGARAVPIQNGHFYKVLYKI